MSTKILSARLGDQLSLDLDNAAMAQQQTRSEAIRQAILDYLERIKKK